MVPITFIRRRWLLSRPFPESRKKILEHRVPCYAHLTHMLKERLQQRMTILLHEKIFEGCGGLSITEEMKTIISAYASLPLLGAPSDYYSGLHSILLYPETYRAPVHEEDEAGVVTEGFETRQGESWSAGSVVLSWQEILNDIHHPGRGKNLILHEFAHQLDDQYGITDGVDASGNVYEKSEWNELLAKTYRKLRKNEKEGVLDPYGATHPAELFAVATEAFFEIPHALRRSNPAFYRMLASFYKVDPIDWMPFR